ncbi:MAG: TadE/TadG family type IV pilus assembly protein [Bacillota bacterium]
MRGGRFTKVIKDENGSAIVEVAVIFPLIIMLVAGFIVLSQAVRIDTVLEVAAREGAREFSVTHDLGRATERAKNELDIGGVDPEKATISVTSNGFDRKVLVEFPFPIYIPFAGHWTGSQFETNNTQLGGAAKPLTLRGSAVFHDEPLRNFN